MICPNCGTELSEGSVYCPKCGQEVQVVSAVDDLEEEILREFMDDEHKPETEDSTVNAVADAKKRRQKKRIRNLIIVIVIVAAALVAFGGFLLHQNHSPDYLLRRAQEEYVQKDYDGALKYLDKLIALDADNEEGLLLEAQVYAAIPEYDQAETDFLRVIEMDPDCADAYEGILEVYSAQGKTDEMRALKQTVTNEEILALFDNYLTPDPEIKAPGGTYTEYFNVEIRAPKKGLTIYYTLDGSVPTRNDLQYVSPIEINQQGNITLTAVCMDEDGNYSDPVSETYHVELIKPDKPVANPDGGEFSSQITITVTAPTGTTVYYTWDNSTPDEDSYRYSGPITVPEGNNILSLIAIDANGMTSDVQRCNFIYYPQATTQTYSYTYEEEEEEDNSDSVEEYDSGNEEESYDDEEENEQDNTDENESDEEEG